MAMPFCDEGGGMVHLGWCCVVEEAQERVAWHLPCRSREEGETGPVWAHHAKKKKKMGGPGDAHARALGGGGGEHARPMEAGGGWDKGGVPGSDTERRKKKAARGPRLVDG
jgi:hypothetical protein